MSKLLKYYGSSLSLDPITVAWLAQLTTSFGSNPSSAYIADLDTMVRGMRADGDILLLDRFWIFAQEVQGYARVSLVNPASTQITEVNSPTWTANQGYTGNGLNMYLNTNYSHSNTSRNDASHLLYSRTDDPSTATNRIEAGAATGGDWSSYIRCGLSGNTAATTNTDANEQALGAVATTLGLYHAVRASSTQHSIYKNGTLINTDNASSLAPDNLNDYVLGRNTSGSMSLPTNKQIAMRALGSGAISPSNFYTRFQTFATARGFNV